MQWNEICRKPVSDSTAITDWNESLRHQAEWNRERDYGARYLYLVNPQGMLTWLYAHRNDTANYILTSLLTKCAKENFIKEHMNQQIKKHPNQQARAYLESIIGKETEQKSAIK